MWKKSMDRERKEQVFPNITENPGSDDDYNEETAEELERKSHQFEKILEVPKEERDRIQRVQVIDRAAAAIAAAHAFLKETPPPVKSQSLDSTSSEFHILESQSNAGTKQGANSGKLSMSQLGAPGPDFWSWAPPLGNNGIDKDSDILHVTQKPNLFANPVNPVMEKEKSVDCLSIPLESNHNPPLPPLQSLMEVDKVDTPSHLDLPSPGVECKLDILFSRHATEAVNTLHKSDDLSSHGVYPDGSKWWKEKGIEQRPDGVVCKWTLTRGISADEGVEWEEKFWEAADQFDYKELGSEKSGRDAAGNVWREYWKESMWQDLKSGLVHIEKIADKWGRNGNGEEWHEKWWEHYDASGQAEKWAHKWCCIDSNTLLEPGHAHVWHERWGEKYDGQGGSMKYTDKWAERSEGDGWTKWGDKWDENFDSNGHGIKQGETWWESQYGERWNRTWGERHNGSGWLHKYGKSSSGEHWDTHVEQETWYERYPHYGFELCLKSSVQLRDVQKLPEAP